MSSSNIALSPSIICLASSFVTSICIPEGNLTPFTSVVSLICTLTHSTGTSCGFFELLIIFSGLAIVLIWQGKDVTFGQRFLIGQLPIASFIFVKYYKYNKYLNLYMWISLIYSYFGNLYFYSSELLTLSPGKNLFGQNSQLAAENYFFNLR